MFLCGNEFFKKMKFAVLLASFLLLMMIGLLIRFFLQNNTRKTDFPDDYDGKEDSRVIKEMAKKIISDAEMHRKNRSIEEE
tara:strand:- start:471 stop:713 length:243 start_codon:yes stop_codon:yes gene_type:complete